MHTFIQGGVEKHFKLTLTTANVEKQVIKKENKLDRLTWEQNNNPTAVLKKLAFLTLKYELTSPISDGDKKKWITKHAPSGYNDTIKNAPMNLCQQYGDLAYVATYLDMQNKINEQYESFADAKAKRAKLSLISQGDTGGRNGGRDGGGRGQGNGLTRQQQSKRDKAAYAKKKKKNGGSLTSSSKVKYFYCGESGHYKNNCKKFKEEGDQLFCAHCNTNGQDEGFCPKLHPDQATVMLKNQRKYKTSLEKWSTLKVQLVMMIMTH